MKAERFVQVATKREGLCSLSLRELILWAAENTAIANFPRLCDFVVGTEHIAPTTCGLKQSLALTTGAKSRMSMDDIKNGQRINCNGVYGTVIGRRSTRNQRFVLVKMDNGFTLKLKADTVSVESPETRAIPKLIGPNKQLATVD